MAPQVCLTEPKGWSDAFGTGCEEYGSQQLCTVNGGYGPGWNKAVWGTFANYSSDSVTAISACCECGGGKSGPAESCSQMECPFGLSLKSDSANLFCKGLDCSRSTDRDICCEAHPDTKAAVEKVEAAIESLKQESIAKLRKQEDDIRKRLDGNSTAAAQKAVATIKDSWREETTQAVNTAKHEFDALVKNRKTFPEGARHQMEFMGYMAARDEVAHGKASVNRDSLESMAQTAATDFNAAAKVWQAAESTAKDAETKGFNKWNSYTVDLKEFWPVVTDGIHKLNDAIQNSIDPYRKVMWAKQGNRVAMDMSQVAQSGTLSLSQQVTTIGHRASEAEKATSANAGRLDELEAIVTNAEEPAE